jgi:hypothetical protein
MEKRLTQSQTVVTAVSAHRVLIEVFIPSVTRFSVLDNLRGSLLASAIALAAEPSS